VAPKLRTKAPKSRKLSTKVPKSPEIRTKVPKSLFPSSKPEPNRSSHPFLSVPFRAAPSTLRITVDVRRGVHVRYVITAIRELDAFVPNMADRVRLAASGADRRLGVWRPTALACSAACGQTRFLFASPCGWDGLRSACIALGDHSAPRWGVRCRRGSSRPHIIRFMRRKSWGSISSDSGSAVRPHRHRDRARLCHIGTGTGLTPTSSAPGPGSPRPHLHWDWAPACPHPMHLLRLLPPSTICTR
jgi:hypothetical protein